MPWLAHPSFRTLPPLLSPRKRPPTLTTSRLASSCTSRPAVAITPTTPPLPVRKSSNRLAHWIATFEKSHKAANTPDLEQKRAMTSKRGRSLVPHRFPYPPFLPSPSPSPPFSSAPLAHPPPLAADVWCILGWHPGGYFEQGRDRSVIRLPHISIVEAFVLFGCDRGLSCSGVSEPCRGCGRTSWVSALRPCAGG